MNPMKELEELNWVDEEVYQLCFDTLGNKKRIQNMTFFDFFLNLMRRQNEDPKGPFFKKLDQNIQMMKDKHMNVNREWRYDFALGRMRTYQELIDRREDSKIDDTIISRGGLDQTMIQRAVEAERKMKKLRMAKYSTELFDEIVIDMMKEKRTMMEMMAELDVDDEKITEAQQRITNARLKAGLSINID